MYVFKRLCYSADINIICVFVFPHSCIQKEGWVVVPVLVSEWLHVLEACQEEDNEVQCLADFIDGITAQAVKEFDEERDGMLAAI